MNFKKNKIKQLGKELSRREFLFAGGSLLTGAIISSCASAGLIASDKTPKIKYAKSDGHIEHNNSRCSGCLSCMTACSLAHEGSASISLSRIQVSRYVFDNYPNDIMGYTCLQCDEPLCVRDCPAGACYINKEKGNVRMIDSEKCIGCGTCLKSCSQTPHRTVWNPSKNKSSKCDLCVNTGYNKKNDSQACVDICPQKALKFIS